MNKRQVRLRREYLFRKNQEGMDAATQERKRALKQALESGQKLPTELAAEANHLKNQADLDVEPIAPQIDDEYAQAGIVDPKIMMTTARDPSTRLTQFLKEMSLIIPGAERVNRGGMDLNALVDACRANEVDDLVVFTETRGQPDGMIVSHFPFGPTVHFTLSNTIMRHDIPDRGTMSEAFPHLIFHNFNSKLGERVMTVLKHLFPVPKEDSKRVVSFINNRDSVSFRHHNYTRKNNGKEISLEEIGPRFEMKPYLIKLGTIEMRTCDTEWVLRPYMNTAKRRKVLGD